MADSAAARRLAQSRQAPQFTMSQSVALFTFGLLLLATAAFWPLYLSRSWSTIDVYTHAHAFLGTLWMLALVVQPILLGRGRRQLHRLVGRASMFVAIGFVLSGLLLTHFRLSRMPDAAFAKDGIYVYLPLAMAALFAVACGMGFRWRTSASVHARFMISTALLLVDPVLARLMFFYLPPLPSDHLYQCITFTLIAVVLLYLVVSLPRKAPGRVWFRNYCLGTSAVLALFFVVPYTRVWLVFVGWLRVLPLT